MRTGLRIWGLLLIALAALPLSADTKRDWRDGTIVKVESEDIAPPSHAQRFFYTIDTGDVLLIATEKVVWRWSKPSQMEVGDTVKWAMRKNDVYIVGSDGKEHTLSLRRQDPKPQVEKKR